MVKIARTKYGYILMQISSYFVRTHGIQLLATKMAGFFGVILL